MKTWTIDPAHSEVQFKVKHLVISTVTGSFDRFSGQLETSSDDFTPATINFEAEVDSINTNNADRDNHLKSADFFDAANYPKISFVSESFEKTGESTYKLTGNFTMRGTTKKITLDVEHGGVMTDPYGNTKAGFELQGKVSRKEFGLSWNAVTEAGGVVVADEVKLLLNIQLAKN
ncbi:MAG TPA: YceI family protein [Bacteroidales bacterium]|nr:YceI family protein [Bacteroidales bacterium]HPE44200.1 YceI family protein [Bacteroidales bacterium]